MDPRLVLSLACSCVEAWVLYRLIRARARLPLFIAYLVITGIEPLAFLVGNEHSRAYSNAWGLATALVLGGRLLIVIELWHKAMRQYRNIQTISRYLAVIIATISISAGCLTGFNDLRSAFGIHRE